MIDDTGADRSETGLEYYARYVRERFDEFLGSYTALVDHLPVPSTERDNALKNAITKLGSLSTAMHSTDQPKWMAYLLPPLRQCATKGLKAPHSTNLLHAIIDWDAAIRSQSWEHLSAGSAEFLDFEAVYSRFLQERRIPDLLDSLLKSLREIAHSGMVDSRTLLAELKAFIGTIERAEGRGPLSVAGIVKFGKPFMTHLAWEAASATPLVGAAVRAAKATLDAMENELYEVDVAVTKELQAEAETKLLPPAARAALAAGNEAETEDRQTEE